VIISVDKKTAHPGIGMRSGIFKLPNGKAITAYNHEYKHNGTTIKEYN
jgi:hypothetical protein